MKTLKSCQDRKLRRLLIGLATLSLTCPVQANKMTFNLGYYHGQNQYTANQDTNIKALYFSGIYKFKQQQIKLSSSYNQLQSTRNGPQSQNEGIGDINLTYKKVYGFNKNQKFFEIAAKIKVPTADENKNLGTGKTDYEFSGSFFQHTGQQRWLVIKTAHRWRGRSSKYAMKNGFNAAIGLTWQTRPTLSYGGLLEYRQASAETNNDRKEIFLYLSHKQSAQAKLTPYLIRGFGKNSTKWAGGIQFAYTLSLP